MSFKRVPFALVFACVSLLSSCGAGFLRAAEPEEEKVRVTVVSILASTQGNKIDERLKEIAREVRDKMPDYTNFTIATTDRRTISLSTPHKFAAVDKNEVTIEAAKGNADRYTMQVKAPTLSSLTYSCVCGKYFPVVTGYETKNGERLIIAVMVDLPKGK